MCNIHDSASFVIGTKKMYHESDSVVKYLGRTTQPNILVIPFCFVRYALLGKLTIPKNKILLDKEIKLPYINYTTDYALDDTTCMHTRTS